MDYLRQKVIEHKRAMFGLIMSLAASFGVWLSPWADRIESRVARPIDISVREWLGEAPKLAPQIKVFGFEDISAGQFQSSDLSLQDWLWLLKGIAKTNPKGIYIDKLFTFAGATSTGGTPLFAKELAGIGVDITVGSFTTAAPIRERRAIPLSYFQDKGLGIDTATDGAPGVLPSWLTAQERIPYGPHQSLLQSFSKVGHIDHEGMGFVLPFRKVYENFLLPHWALSQARSLNVTTKTPMLEGRAIPVDGKGRILANFLKAGTIEGRMRNFVWLGSKIKSGELGATIGNGDFVVLLPSLFTGNTDIKDSPVGRIPGGFILVAILNSVISGEWLREIPFGAAFFIPIGLFGLCLATTLSPVAFAIGITGSTLLLFLGAMASFSYGNIYCPWIHWEISLWTSSAIVFVDRMRRREEHRKRLRSALMGMVSSEKLDAILEREATFRLEVSEQVITVMFVDIVEFSAYAEQRPPKEVFDQLRSILGYISETVHSFGGIVDRVLGDGLLCYFGYRFDSTQAPTSTHADAAMMCALKIQRDHMAKSLLAFEGDYLLNPIRIGINSSMVFVGDLGTNEKIDFTVIGHGVNFAQRLEAACEPSRIMLTKASFDLLTKFDITSPGFATRLIRMKNQTTAIQVYEFDPFHDNDKNLQKALENYRSQRNIQRKDDRWPVPENLAIEFTTEFGRGRLINFSNFGFAIELDQYLAKGLRFHLSLKNEFLGVTATAAEQLRIPLTAEVRWGRKGNSGYLHGIQVHNMDSRQLDLYVSALRQALHGLVLKSNTKAI